MLSRLRMRRRICPTGDRESYRGPPVPQVRRCEFYNEVERGLPYTNILVIQIPTVFIGLRPTGLPGTVKEFVMKVVSAQLDKGVHDVARVEIARAMSQAGGSVSRTVLKLALAELSEGTTRLPLRLIRVSPGRYALRARSSGGQ